jgi:hypothetical protein
MRGGIVASKGETAGDGGATRNTRNDEQNRLKECNIRRKLIIS